jgi:F0F1-type ATP synthase delta subunit
MFLVNLVIIQTIIFAIVIFVLKKILYGDTRVVVDRLEDSFKETAKKKQEIAEKVMEMEEEYKKKKLEAEGLALQYKEEAEQDIKDKQDESYKKSKSEAERIVTDAQNMREKIRLEIAAEESNKMYKKCAELFNAVFEDMIRGKMNDIMLEDFLADMQKVEASHIPSNIDKIELVSSEQLSEEYNRRLGDTIRGKMSGNTPIEASVDEELVGGIMVKFGSLVLDGSIKNRLQEKLNEKVA